MLPALQALDLVGRASGLERAGRTRREADPQAAVVGIVVDDHFEIFFDTLATSRKCRNLRHNPRFALVIGWDWQEACTLQLQGHADEPTGDELARFKNLYFAPSRTALSDNRGPISATSAFAPYGRASVTFGPPSRHCGVLGRRASVTARRLRDL
ncbi:pyridoxamine 5'-phosphate oxidase family protein [Mesorhizobium sp.]|uniref:pyridoxamine 5'-phosphate oxidase family protein n=1 Tax=Mesorhizobium sp. TaxID=1871066 RepID=UPI0025B89536|nr:pyridoxamine 5'-phosphate oxidase family protein [Mesorhizobium sp.]